MLPISYFTSVHKVRRPGGQNPSTKRKRDENDKDIDVSMDGPSSRGDHVSGGSSFEPTSFSSAFASSQAAPHEHHFGDEASEPTFEVHDYSASRRIGSKRSHSRSVLKDSLGKLQPPLLGPQVYPSSGLHASQEMNVGGARQRHLAVLTTIMHRSLLQTDYVRAGRAWSMILRSELDGHSVDLRNGCRWGLGAEILLRQSSPLSGASIQPTSAVEVNGSAAENPGQCFSLECFQKIKKYYDRLSLQYPYHKSFPNAIGPLDFRFAMFSTWIYTCTHQKIPNVNVHQPISFYTARYMSEQQMTEDIRRETLRQAREVSEWLEELMSSPPYSDSERFKNLKVMVDLWTADLAMATLREGSAASNVYIAGSNQGLSTAGIPSFKESTTGVTTP